MKETHGQGRRTRRNYRRRRIAGRLLLGLLLVLVPLVAPYLYRTARQWGTASATIGFTETNSAAGELTAIVTIDDDATIETIATCKPASDGKGSSCTAPVRLRRGAHAVKVRVMHSDGRWTPESEPTVIDVP